MYPVYKPIGKREECEEVNLAFPSQHQERQPGLEYLMNPRPISENPYATFSGRLKDKVAIITGGDSGIGRAIAYAFAREGAHLVIAYLDEHIDAKETQQHILNLGQECILVPGDLSKKAEAQKVIEKALHRFGQIDILVNNHALQYVANSILDIIEEQLDQTFKTNIYSFFYLVQAALPYLKRGSSIINTTSVTAYKGEKELIDYSATKGAILSFTRSLSQSLIEKGIRVNGVAPGPIWTPLQPASWSSDQIETFGTKTPKVPMNRAGQPFEVAPSYVFLASDDSSYMTGQILHPNGGTITST
ncbi:MAG: SDR family oxidoreductase [Turicibacter sp.]|nr:SDR family oxidoreductase [Turicibacter sp.]